MAQHGDTLLLATDGLTKLVKDERLQDIISAHGSDLNAATAALIQAAKDEGGDDNITCILLRIVRLPWYKRWWYMLAGGRVRWQNSI